MSSLSGKKPILMLPMSLDIGGAETHVVGLARSLKERGWPVYVASAGGRRVKDLEDAGIKHFSAPLHSRSPLKMLRASMVIADLVRRYDIGLVHAHARIPAYLSEKICNRRRLPLVTTYHWTFVSGPFWNLFTKPGDLTIAVSQDIKDYVVREFGFDSRKITVVPNGIDTDLFAPNKARDVAGREPTVLYMSRLNKELSQTAIATMQAVFSIRQSHPGIKMLVAGDGISFQDVEAEAHRLNSLAGRDLIQCLGFVLDTPTLFKEVDLVVGMSRVVLEAMACEIPTIIAGPNGSYGPVTEDIIKTMEEVNYTSRGAPVQATPEVLANDIHKLLSDDELSYRLGKMGRQVVLEKHSMALVAEETEKVYQRLLRG